MMEKAKITAFKELPRAKYRAILDSVINTYCDGPMKLCSYSNLEAMYEQEFETSAEEARWCPSDALAVRDMTTNTACGLGRQGAQSRTPNYKEL